MKIKECVLILGFLIAAFTGVFAQGEMPISWEYEVARVEGNEALLVFKAQVDEGWHVYGLKSTDDDSGMGPLPTVFEFEDSELYHLKGELKPSREAGEHYDEAFMMNVYYYEGEVEFSQLVQVRKSSSTEIVVEINYMVCDNEQCIFPDPIEYTIIIDNE